MSAVDVAIAFAQAQIGKPYLYGGTGPNAWDCSGLMQAAYAAAGISIPRTTQEQWAAEQGHTVALTALAPGDLVFFGTAPPVGIHHVAMYVGNGTVIAAPHTGDVVKYEPLSVFSDTYSAARPSGSVGSPVNASLTGFSLNPLKLIPGAGAIAGAVLGPLTPVIKLGEVAMWLVDPHNLIRVFEIMAGVVVVVMGVYLMVKDTEGGSAMISQAKQGATMAVMA